MSPIAVRFDRVSKSYHLNHHIVSGFKHFLFNLPKALQMIRSLNSETLKEVSFEIHKGEIFGVIGQSGAGKSTTMSLIAGVLKPTHGTVNSYGKTLPLLHLGEGFYPDLTGRENIILNGVLLGHTKKFVASRIDQIIEFADIGSFIDEPVRIYPRNMIKQLDFSVVTSLDPEILLIDEIVRSEGVDSFSQKCFDRIQQLKRSGVTVVFVSHNLGDILKICDRVLWLENHTVKMLGPTRAVVEAYSGKIL